MLPRATIIAINSGVCPLARQNDSCRFTMGFLFQIIPQVRVESGPDVVSFTIWVPIKPGNIWPRYGPDLEHDIKALFVPEPFDVPFFAFPWKGPYMTQLAEYSLEKKHPHTSRNKKMKAIFKHTHTCKLTYTHSSNTYTIPETRPHKLMYSL